MRTKMMAGVLAGLALLTTGCGDDDDAAPSGDTAAAVTTDATTVTTVAATDPADPGADPADPDVDDEDVPDAIISLSPSSTEMLFAIGAGDQVIAVDPFSNHPADAAAKMTELSAFEPNVEAIAGFEPDLVITDGTNLDLLSQLDSLGIAHWEGPAAVTLSDTYDQIEQLGALTGHLAESAELVAAMQGDIDEILAGLPATDTPLTYYHELDSSYYSATSETFVGYVYSQLGLRNIADRAEGSGGPYPQLNAEFIISTNPDLIFLACTKYCGETAETVADRPGWSSISAVQNGGVIEMDDDIASRWGPRVVDYLRDAADAVAAAAARQPAG